MDEIKRQLVQLKDAADLQRVFLSKSLEKYESMFNDVLNSGYTLENLCICYLDTLKQYRSVCLDQDRARTQLEVIEDANK